VVPDVSNYQGEKLLSNSPFDNDDLANEYWMRRVDSNGTLVVGKPFQNEISVEIALGELVYRNCLY